MKYTVITPDGELTHHDDKIDWDAVIGHEGKAHVRLHPSLASAGWVNDVGLLFPETHPRNAVGSCLLVAMGARPQPYAGPVVITGWDSNSETSEICSLLLPADAVTELHRRVRAALNGDSDPHFGPQWAQGMRTFAERVRTDPTRGITITPITNLPGGAS